MIKIEKALAVPAKGGFFNDDLQAIHAGAKRDGFGYQGDPMTPGFQQIRQPSEAISIVLLLDNGVAVSGDGMSVTYAGAGGRIPRFQIHEQLPLLGPVCRWLEGKSARGFLGLCEELQEQKFGADLHRPAVFYAASQALLQAVAQNEGMTCAQVFADELGLTVARTLIPIYIQCGEDRYDNVDKSILKEVDVLPHGLINSPELIGPTGDALAEYVSWISARVAKYGREGYWPEIHIDVYGLVGHVLGHSAEKIADYLAELGERARPYDLNVETPVLLPSREAQIHLLSSIRRELERRGSDVRLVVDEWANDLDDIRAFIAAGATHSINVKAPDLGAVSNVAKAVDECWKGGVRPILGGSCAETDQSARIMAHVALATSPAWVLARPGMGVDEGLQITYNEMARTLAIIKSSDTS